MARGTTKKTQTQTNNMIFALDIGTRSIIGMVGIVNESKVKIIAIEREEHSERVMIDGQIEDIQKVASLAQKVKKKLEQKLQCKLTRVCVAAAGRALRTMRADYELELPQPQLIDDELISRLEVGAISKAEESFEAENNSENNSRRFYLAGYTVCQYYLDQYILSNLKDHRGSKLRADLIATFLPSEVVESLYTAMRKIDLEIASITLEPIAAINAAIPENLRLLNLVMVDIGAGTSDIAACSGGSVIGYTMATLAGDEITETIMKTYLVDFETAEMMKASLHQEQDVTYTDVLGLEQKVSQQQLAQSIQETITNLCNELSAKILEINGSAPSALFLAGGGSKLAGLKDKLATVLQMEPSRIAIAGNNFKTNAYSDEYDLNNPEYATPLGIVISSGLNLLNDGFRVTLNGKPAKLFRSGSFTALNLLMMNGYTYQDILGQPGFNITVTLNGKRKVFYGTTSQPASLFINKKESKLSDIIQAGDNILFTPAVAGIPATPCLGDIEGATTCQSLTLNGFIMDLDTPLKNGDVIIMTPSLDEKKRIEKQQDTDISPKFEPQKTEAPIKQTENQQPEPKSNPEIQIMPAPKITPEIQTKPEHRTTLETNPISEIKPTTDQKAESILPTTKKKSILFYLNDSPLSLPIKEDNKPYRLMDMIQYSGIDLKQPKGNVKLSVNGNSCSFQQPLAEGDIITVIEELK